MKKRNIKSENNLGEPLPLVYLNQRLTSNNNNPTTKTNRKPPSPYIQSRNVTPIINSNSRSIPPIINLNSRNVPPIINSNSNVNGDYILRPNFPTRARLFSRNKEINQNNQIKQRKEGIKAKLRNIISEIDDITDEEQLDIINNKIGELLGQDYNNENISREINQTKLRINNRVKYKENREWIEFISFEKVKYPIIFLLIFIGLYFLTSLLLADFAYQYCYYFC